MKNELNKLLENRIYNHEECVSKIEKIADDYAVEFADFCLKNRKALHTTEGLLQIFKKEKGL